MDRKKYGDRAERIAAKCLEESGMQIIGRNVRMGGGEIDIVALEGEIVAIVEVKARSDPGARPAEAVTRAKIKKISRAALAYLSDRGWLEREIRFDVVEIVDDGAVPTVNYIRNAFLFDASVMYR